VTPRRLLLLSALGTGLGCASGQKPAPAADAKAPGAPLVSARLSNSLPPPKVVPPATTDQRAKDAFARAVRLAQAGDLPGAEKALGEVLDRDSRLDHAWTDLGVLAERRGDLSGAEKDYRQALSLAPDQEAAWDFLSRLLCRQGRAQEVQQLASARSTASPSAPGPRNALAFALLQLNQPQAAETELKKVLKDDERNVQTMQLLSQAYFRQGKYELSKLVLENARAVDGADAVTHNLLGDTLLKLKQRPQALEEFRAAAQGRPDFAEARNNYGVMLVEASDFDGAVRELEAAVALAPDFIPARLNLGNAYRGKLELARAEAQYQKVVQLQPALADTYFNLAILNLDSELPGVDTGERMNRAIAYFKTYRDKGGTDDRVDQYLKDAAKGVEREQRRKEREKKDQLRKVEKDKAAAAPGKSAAAAAKPASKAADTPVPAAKSGKPASKLSDTPAPAAPAKLGGSDK
jgi:Tfp pilus assembly protein PilF